MLSSQRPAVKSDGNYTYRQRRWYGDLGHETTVVSFVRDGCGIGEAIRLRRRVFHALIPARFATSSIISMAKPMGLPFSSTSYCGGQ